MLTPDVQQGCSAIFRENACSKRYVNNTVSVFVPHYIQGGRLPHATCLQHCVCVCAALYSGSGSGTYYYDVRTQCPQDTNGYPETDGYAACESYAPGPNQQTLRQGNTDNVVAIDMNLLKANRAQLCGKQIIVSYNGAPVSAPDGGDFYVWDGCAACVGGGRIDFSVSGLENVDPNACELGVVPGVSWQVVDVQSRPFVA
jgi:hypothetical protein